MTPGSLTVNCGQETMVDGESSEVMRQTRLKCSLSKRTDLDEVALGDLMEDFVRGAFGVIVASSCLTIRLDDDGCCDDGGEGDDKAGRVI